jgi:hypothetical protein
MKVTMPRGRNKSSRQASRWMGPVAYHDRHMSSLRPNEMEALKAAQTRSATSETPGQVQGFIDTDRTCMTCGYELRGLPLGSDCPECGLTTRIPETIDDPLSLMPIEMIRRLKWGCWAVFWCMLITFVLGIVLSQHQMPDGLVLGALAAVSLSWQVAVRLATPALGLPQGVLRGFSRRGKLRFAAHWFQIGWVIAATSAVVLEIGGRSGALTDVSANLLRWGIVAGLIGLILLALMFERLSEWSRDDQAQKVFNTIAWGLPFAVLLLLWTPSNALLALVLKVIAIAALLVYPFSVLVLARSVGFSVYHGVEHTLRTERQQERRDRFFEKVVNTVADATAGPADDLSNEIELSETRKERKQ